MDSIPHYIQDQHFIAKQSSLSVYNPALGEVQLKMDMLLVNSFVKLKPAWLASTYRFPFQTGGNDPN